MSTHGLMYVYTQAHAHTCVDIQGTNLFVY